MTEKNSMFYFLDCLDLQADLGLCWPQFFVWLAMYAIRTIVISNTHLLVPVNFFVTREIVEKIVLFLLKRGLL